MQNDENTAGTTKSSDPTLQRLLNTTIPGIIMKYPMSFQDNLLIFIVFNHSLIYLSEVIFKCIPNVILLSKNITISITF